MSSVYATPIINDNIGTEFADQVHHIVQNLRAPDFFRFFRCFRIAKVFGAGEIEFHAVAASGRKQFLCANQSQLRRLLWAEHVLPTFAARQGEQRYIGMQAASKIGQHRAALIVRVRSNVQDPGGYTRAIDGLNGFRQAVFTLERGRLRANTSTGQREQRQQRHRGSGEK